MSDVPIIPLKIAYLCPDCLVISSHSCWCPQCAGNVMLSLAKVLDRKIDEPPSEKVATT